MRGLNTAIRVDQPYFFGVLLRLDGPISRAARWHLSGPPALLAHLTARPIVIDAASADIPAPGAAGTPPAWPTWATLDEAEAEIPLMLRGARVLALPYDRVLDRARSAGDTDSPRLGVYGVAGGCNADLYYGDHSPVTSLPFIGRAQGIERGLFVALDHLGNDIPMVGHHGAVFIYCDNDQELADLWLDVYNQGAVYISSEARPDGGFMLSALITYNRAALRLGQVWTGLVVHPRYFDDH